MIRKLEKSLQQQGDAFKEVEATLNNALSEHESAERAYQHVVKKIMKENRVIADGSQFQIAQKMTVKDVLNPPIHQDLIGLKSRLIAGGSAGVVAETFTIVVINKRSSQRSPGDNPN